MRRKARAGRRLGWMLGIGAALLVGAGVLLYTFVFQNADAKKDALYEEAFLSYVSCVTQEEYEAMYDMLDEASRELIDEETFLARNGNIYAGIEARNIEVEVLEIIEVAAPSKEALGSRSIRYTLRMDTQAGPLEFQHSALVHAFKPEKEVLFRLAWEPGLILPQLGWQDRVRVSKETGVRGSIYDRNGEVLAGQGTVKAVGFVPGKMQEDSSAVIQAVAEVLELSVESIEKALSAKWAVGDVFVPLKSLSEADVARKEQLLEIKGGILIRDEIDRVYPLGQAAAHLTGYVQDINKEELDERPGQNYHSNSRLGKIGLESLLEERIRAIDGCRIVIQDSDGNEKAVVLDRPARNGENITLTIDSALQKQLYDLMAEEKGTAVVMDYRTGEVLALVSTPAYDPNEFVLGLVERLWDEWREDPRRPLFNRFKATFVPGSALKPIVAAIGINTGKLMPDENMGYHGRSWQLDESWGGYKVTTLQEYGQDVRMRNALVYSDNIYFAKAALRLGADTLAAEFQALGFGEQMPFAFGLSASSFGSESAFGSQIELADSGYGQGRVLVNPLHLASMYSGLLNGGDMLGPTLYKSEPAILWKPGAYSSEAAEFLRGVLLEIVEDPAGTAHEVRTGGYTIGGKTGTAEIKESQEDATGTELGWFVGFCEENGRLFTGMIEDVKGRGGSHFVTPIGKAILAGQ